MWKLDNITRTFQGNFWQFTWRIDLRVSHFNSCTCLTAQKSQAWSSFWEWTNFIFYTGIMMLLYQNYIWHISKFAALYRQCFLHMSEIFSKGQTIIYNQINNLNFLYFLPLFHGPSDRVSRHKSRQTLIYSNILWSIFHMLWCLCNILWCIVNIMLWNIF